MCRDKYGNYVNDKGVTIKITEDKNGNDHISFYDGPVDGDHSAAHINVNYDKGTWSANTHGEDKSDTDNSSGSCYLTTACMKHYMGEFDDNCHELSLLRQFRDEFVSPEDINHYYKVAPSIVKTIDNLPDGDSVYSDIYHNTIEACVQAIEKKEYDTAYNTYKNSVLDLESRFLS